MLDLDELLNTNADELPDEVRIPAGRWRVKGKKLLPGEKALTLVVTVLDACNDVDPDELELWQDEKNDDAGFIKFLGNDRAQSAQLKRVCQMLDLHSVGGIIGAEFIAELKYDQDRNDTSKFWPRWRVVGPVE